MFTSAKRIEEKTGRFGRGRFEYLQALVTEFQDTHKQGLLNDASMTSLYSYD